MKIIHRKRAWWDKPLEIHKDTCSCSLHTCGERWHTMGWTIYLFNHVIIIAYDKPKGCDALF